MRAPTPHGTGSLAVAHAVLAGSLAQNKTRAAVATCAIALGVALGLAVQLINQTAIGEFALGVQALSGDADLEVRGPRGGFDETLFPELARLPEVAVASPVVEVDAKLPGRDEPLRILGVDAFRVVAINPALVATVDERLDLFAPDALFLSPAAARWLGAHVGDDVSFQVGLADVTLRVAGLLATGREARFATMDIATAQWRFDRLSRLSRIDLRLVPGVDVSAFRERLTSWLPAGIAAVRPETSLAAGASLSRSYRVNLAVLALVALFTGGLLVFSTQALTIVRRRPQFALLRVLGVTRRRLAALIVAEGALLGVAGSLLGVAAGYALARLAVQLVGVDLGSGYFRGIAPTLAPDPFVLAGFFALGVAAAALGSLAPALEVAQAAPALALKAGDEERALAGLRPLAPGLVTLGLGACATLAPPVAGLPLFGYLAIALLLVGTLMLIPRIAVVLFALLPPLRFPPIVLAVAQLRGAPGQATVSLAATVASVSLMVSMAIMVASFRQSLDDWLERLLPADVYVRVGAGDTAYLTPEDQARMAALPGVRRAEFLREAQLLLDPSRPRVALLARHVDAASPARSLPLIGAPIEIARDAPPPVWVSEAVVDLYGAAPGHVITLPLAGKPVRFTVAGVWRDYARQQGAIAIERERYTALTGDDTVTNAALWLAPGTGADDVRAALAEALPGGDRLELAMPGEIRSASLAVFDRTFAVTYALELAAVLIGLVGMSSSFAALVLARRREFGVLRHLGMTRKRVGMMLATEGFVVSGVGLAAGVTLGALISLVLIHVVNRQSFHWGMELAIPWLTLAAFVLVMLALSTLIAVTSGRLAMGMQAVRAVKEDW